MEKYMQLFEAEQRPDQLTLVRLPYKLEDLEPVMSEATVDYHYNKLSRAYVDRYNSGEGDADFNWGGAMLHNMWWPQLRPAKGANRPTGAIADLIDDRFGSYEEFRDAFAKEAMALQGSGWCYLSRSGDIKTLKNQSYNKSVLLPVDAWEHAFLLDPKPDKARYFKNIWKIINWDVINHRMAGQ
jgi:Fe-Mn family superoxide dismutase